MARVKIRLEDATDLPPVCVCCGEPATRTRRQEFEVSTALTGAVFAAAGVLGALAWTARGVALALPVCEYHKRNGRRSNRTFFRGLLLTTALGVASYLGSWFDAVIASYLAVASMFAFIVTMLVAMQQVGDGLGVKSLTRESFTLTGASKEFVAAVGRRDQDRTTRR